MCKVCLIGFTQSQAADENYICPKCGGRIVRTEEATMADLTNRKTCSNQHPRIWFDVEDCPACRVLGKKNRMVIENPTEEQLQKFGIENKGKPILLTLRINGEDWDGEGYGCVVYQVCGEPEARAWNRDIARIETVEERDEG